MPCYVQANLVLWNLGLRSRLEASVPSAAHELLMRHADQLAVGPRLVPGLPTLSSIFRDARDPVVLAIGTSHH